MSLTRRDVLTAGVGLASAPLVRSFPHIWVPDQAAKPLVIASGNGNTVKHDTNETCVQRAFRMMTGGTDVLDALIAGVNIVELDPADTSVGYGGLPNAEGVVQLDSCLMHGRKKWAGGVASLEGVRTPSSVARAVMQHTDHHLLVGPGAREFARRMGFTIEADLNTDASRRVWLEWMRRTDPGHYLDPAKRDGNATALAMIADGWINPDHYYGTINCNGIAPNGDIAGVTTTSGLAFKIPGRVGDSPILGAGLYVDQSVGAAGSTGRGEANLYNLSSYLIVEEMRRGAHPKDAGITALKRVAQNTEKRLQHESGRPAFNLQFYMLDAKGRHAGVVMFGGGRYAVCDEGGPRYEDLAPAF